MTLFRSHFFRTALFLAALNLSAVRIPGIMPELSRLAGLLAVIVWIALYFPLRLERTARGIAALAVILISMGMLLSESLFLVGLAGCVCALCWLTRENDGTQDRELPVYAATVLFYTAFHLFHKFSPHFWYALQTFSLRYSVAATSVIGQKMTLGPSAAGLPITVSVLCHCLSLAWRRESIHFVVPAILIPLLANLLFLWLQWPLTKLTLFFDKTLDPTAPDFQAVLLILSVIMLYPLSRKTDFKETPLWFRAKSGRVAAVCVVCVFAGFFSLSYSGKGAKKDGEILFLERGTNWVVPHYGKNYGQHSVGMFGIAPNYLKMRGYEARIVRKELTPKELKNASVVAVFNPAQYLTGPEKQALYAFVKAGGSLLIAGDHTDVGGVMGPINDILAPVPIRLNFDTALPAKSGWVDGLEKRPNPINQSIEKDHDAGIWVGASLDISQPARPVIIGKYGWADIGNYMNTKRAYLGDYKRSSDEQLGDVVLVAESPYGKGKVLVFGDTSTFQNGIVMSACFFMDGIFHWLTSDAGTNDHPALRGIVALMLVFAAGWVLKKYPCMALTIACVLAAHAGWQTADSLGDSKPETGYRVEQTGGFAYEPALIDVSHMERFSVLASVDNSIWGLGVNLMRNGFIPLFLKELTETALETPRLLVVIAPTKSFSEKETAILRKYMENGGKIIWSVGWEELGASASFLAEFGLSVDAVPLGPAEVDVENYNFQFVEAWPVTGGDANRQIIAEKWGHPAIVWQPVGKGGILLIADSQFLLSSHVESYKNYDMKMIRFVKYLLDRLFPRRTIGLSHPFQGLFPQNSREPDTDMTQPGRANAHFSTFKNCAIS